MELSGKILQRGPIMPSFVLRANINPGAKQVYALLLNLCGPRNRCWPSQNYIADQVGQCLRSVQNYIKELEAFGLIAIQRHRDGNIYSLLPHPIVIAELRRRQAQAQNEKSAHAHLAAGIKEEKKKNPPLPPPVREGVQTKPHSAGWQDEALTAFETLWLAWPVQEARKAAQRLWLRLWRLGSLPPLDQIQSLVQANLERNPRWKRGFIPFLVTWLRERRWDDVIQEPKETHPQNQPKASEGHENQRHFDSKEKRQTQTTDDLPEAAWVQLNHVLSIWPVAASTEDTSRIRGLWRYLFKRGQLPDVKTLSCAATRANQTFSRWLHAYQQKTVTYQPTAVRT
jgi:hypothetical protein